jgi:very-short-patch-repair endonuclease
MRLNPTRPERVLWYALRNRALEGLKFRRQAPIGHHIVDFFCAEARLVVEVDGETHVDAPQDGSRDVWLRNRGYAVLRFWNNEIMGNLPGVLELIRQSAAHVHTPPPDRLPQGEGER